MGTPKLLRVLAFAFLALAITASVKPVRAAEKATEKASGKATSLLVDLNSADERILGSLPGVGSATAKAIIAARPFKSIEDLKKVKGIGDAKFAALKDKVAVGSAPAAPAAPVSPPATVAPAAPKAVPAAPSPAKAKTAVPGAPKLAPGTKVNINTASKETLQALPRIGRVKAQAIIDGRPYKTIEDIMRAKGIKEGEFARLKDTITVN